MLALVTLPSWVPAIPLSYLARVWLLTTRSVRPTAVALTPLSTTTLVLVLIVLRIRLNALALTLTPCIKGVQVPVTRTVPAMSLVVLTRPLPSSILLDKPQWRPAVLFIPMVHPLKGCTPGAAPWALSSMALQFVSLLTHLSATAVTLSTCRRQPSVACLLERTVPTLLHRAFSSRFPRIWLLLRIV